MRHKDKTTIVIMHDFSQIEPGVRVCGKVAAHGFLCNSEVEASVRHEADGEEERGCWEFRMMGGFLLGKSPLTFIKIPPLITTTSKTKTRNMNPKHRSLFLH
jgi:hypothetical protein